MRCSSRPVRHGKVLVVRMCTGAWPAAAAMAEHVALILAQRFGVQGSRVVADCQAVISGFIKWRASVDSGLEYKNPYGGKWAHMSRIRKDRGIDEVVKDIR